MLGHELTLHLYKKIKADVTVDKAVQIELIKTADKTEQVDLQETHH